MNNQQTNDPSLASIQNELIGEDSNNENKSSIKESKILIISCLAMCIVFFIVYALWMSIPVKKHDIQVEFLASSQNEAKASAHIILSEIKNFNIDQNLANNLDNDSSEDGIIIDNSIGSNSSYRIYRIGNSSHNKANPKILNNTESLSNIIGHKLYKELNDYCQKNNLELNDFTNLFYYRDLQNYRLQLQPKMKHTIRSGGSGISITGINDFDFSNYLRDSLSVFPNDDYTKQIKMDRKALSKLGYKCITESLILVREDFAIDGTDISIYAPNKFLMLLWKLFQIEDITQSYYIIHLGSSTIRHMSLLMKFYGTINCVPFKLDPTINIEPISVEKDTCYPYFKKGEFKVSKNNYSSTSHMQNFYSDNRSIRIVSDWGMARLKCLVKFNDLENIQTMRLFILAAFFTLALTTIIKTIWKIRRFIWKRLIKVFGSLWRTIVIGTTKLKMKAIHSQKKQSKQSPSE